MKKTNSLGMAVFCHYCGTVLKYHTQVEYQELCELCGFIEYPCPCAVLAVWYISS